MKLKLMLLAAAMLVTGCVQTGKSDPCAGWKPIRLSEASITGLTGNDPDEVLAHNEFGRARGCW